MAEIHGQQWYFPEGLPLSDGLVLDIPGWHAPKELPKNIDELWALLRPLALLHVPSSGVKITVAEPDLLDVPGWKQPLDPPSTPQMVDERREWLSQACLRLVATEWPELELQKLPPNLRSQALYLELHWERVVRTVKLARYRRVKNDTRRADFLSAALADLKRAPSYAIDNYERESRLQKPRSFDLK